jgi:hypothetical protein
LHEKSVPTKHTNEGTASTNALTLFSIWCHISSCLSIDTIPIDGTQKKERERERENASWTIMDES